MEKIDELSEKKQRLIRLLLERQKVKPFALLQEQDRKLLPDDIEDAFPLGAVQLGMLYNMERTKGKESPADYHNVSTVRLKFKMPFDLACFQKSVDSVVVHHPYLRTYFDLGNYSEPIQLIKKEARLQVGYENLCSLPEAEKEQHVWCFIEQENFNLMDVGIAPLMRFFVHQLDTNVISLSYTEPHSLADGWSTHLTLVDIIKGYLAGRKGNVIRFPENLIQYQDFIRAERQAIESAQTRLFWREKIADINPVILPSVPGVVRDDANVDSHLVESFLDRQVSAGLYRIVEQFGAPMKCIFQAVNARLLSLFTGQSRVTFGVPFNGRLEQSGGTDTRGLFLNTLPLTVSTNVGSWKALVKQISQSELEILPHRRYPISYLLRFNNNNPVYRVATGFLHFHSVKDLLDEGEVEVLTSVDLSKTNMDFFCIFRVMPEDALKIKLLVHGNSDLYSFGELKFYADCLKSLVEELIESSQAQTLEGQYPTPAIEQDIAASSEHLFAENECEFIIFKIWKSLLKNDIHPAQHFLKCGGSLLLGVKLSNRILEQFSVVISVADLLAAGNIKQQAKLVMAKVILDNNVNINTETNDVVTEW